MKNWWWFALLCLVVSLPASAHKEDEGSGLPFPRTITFVRADWIYLAGPKPVAPPRRIFDDWGPYVPWTPERERGLKALERLTEDLDAFYRGQHSSDVAERLAFRARVDELVGALEAVGAPASDREIDLVSWATEILEDEDLKILTPNNAQRLEKLMGNAPCGERVARLLAAKTIRRYPKAK